jgi:hypothetical protein
MVYSIAELIGKFLQKNNKRPVPSLVDQYLEQQQQKAQKEKEDQVILEVCRVIESERARERERERVLFNYLFVVELCLVTLLLFFCLSAFRL